MLQQLLPFTSLESPMLGQDSCFTNRTVVRKTTVLPNLQRWQQQHLSRTPTRWGHVGPYGAFLPPIFCPCAAEYHKACSRSYRD